MKKIILICSLLISVIGFGQSIPSIVQRASPAYSENDPNISHDRMLIIPRFYDTTEANSKWPTLDSAGKIIYTRSDKSFWYRQDYPKKWVQVLTNDTSSRNQYIINIVDSLINNSVSNVQILNDSTVRICDASGACVNIGITTTVTNINYVSFYNDSTLIVCRVDTIASVCDTISITPQTSNYLFTNGIRQFNNKQVEFGDNSDDGSGGLSGAGQLRHNTTLDARYSKLSFYSAKVYDYGFQINKYPNFGFESGTGLMGWLHENNAYNPNTVRLGVNFTDSIYQAGLSDLPGYFGTQHNGYFFGTNLTGYGVGMNTDDANAKIAGIFFDVKGTDSTAIFIYGKHPPNAALQAKINLGQTMEPYKIATFNTDKTIVFHGYDSTNTSVGNLLNDKVLSTDSTGKVILSKVVGARNVMPERTTILYSMPNSNLTNSYDDYTVGGAMATATITQVGGYDNIIVGGTDQNSYFYPTNRIFTGTPIYGHLRVKAISLGGTAPILGFRILSAPSPYVNFTNQQGYIYVNLSSGTMTSSFSGYATTTTQNSFSATVAANEIVDVYFKWEYNNTMEMKIVKNNLNGDMSQIVKTWVAQSSASASICRLAAIMADGTYQLLSYEIGVKSFERPKVLLAGDSEISGACISFESTIYSQLKGSMSYNIAQFSAPASYLAGMQAVQRDIIQLNPEVVFFDNILDALYNNDCDPADPQFATWSANFNKYVNNLIEAGIEPILFVPSCTPLYPDSRVTTMINYWTTNFPGRQYVERTSTEGGFDCTGFHLNADANAIIVTKLITALNTLNKL